MVKKKQFIDKKKALHFRVVHRSQRDTECQDEPDSNFVLLPTAAKGTSNSVDTNKENLPKINEENEDAGYVNEDGFTNDGYDYRQHMKPIGTGRFFSSHAAFNYSNNDDPMVKPLTLKEDDDLMATISNFNNTSEEDRLLDAITLTTDHMDDDIREALVNADCFEEIDDFFVVDAATVPENDEVADDFFDFDAHIEQLKKMHENKDRLNSETPVCIDTDEVDSDIEVLNSMFDQVILEYDDEDIGELDDTDCTTKGKVELDGAFLDEIFDDFKQMKQDLMDDEGKIGNAMRTGNNLEEIKAACAERDLMQQEDTLYIYEDDIDAPLELDNVCSEYLVRKKTEQWDCESIVSTYSTFDNHPTVIRSSSANRTKPKHKRIELSEKTGMPKGDELSRCSTMPAGNSGAVEAAQRSRIETLEEKKARKAAVRESRRQARINKKMIKTAFVGEEKKQKKQLAQAPVAFATFKY